MTGQGMRFVAVATILCVVGISGVAHSKTDPRCTTINYILHRLESQVEGLSMLMRHAASDPEYLRAWISPINDVERHVLEWAEKRSRSTMRVLSSMIARVEEDRRLFKRRQSLFCPVPQKGTRP